MAEIVGFSDLWGEVYDPIVRRDGQNNLLGLGTLVNKNAFGGKTTFFYDEVNLSLSDYDLELDDMIVGLPVPKGSYIYNATLSLTDSPSIHHNTLALALIRQDTKEVYGYITDDIRTDQLSSANYHNLIVDISPLMPTEPIEYDCYCAIVCIGGTSTVHSGKYEITVCYQR